MPLRLFLFACAMYLPSHFEERRTEILLALVRAHPLATLVTLSADGLVANYVPMLWRASGGPLGTLVGHVARANPLWQATRFDVPVLACFQGPQTYISPSLYASKTLNGKVVPTWNYVVVQANGPLMVHDDPDWIRAQVTELTQQQETPRSSPWAVSDAPRDYTDTLIRALVGISIPVATLVGKWKVSQNQTPANQGSVVQGLAQSGDRHSLAMSEMVCQAALGKSNSK